MVCLNGGTCIVNGTQPQCKCMSGFIGNTCQIAILSTSTTTTTTTTTTTKTTTNALKDMDPLNCPLYAIYNYCMNNYYISGIPIPTYCAKSCSPYSATQCTDSQYNCVFWGATGNCSLLPDPSLCRKSCGLC